MEWLTEGAGPRGRYLSRTGSGVSHPPAPPTATAPVAGQWCPALLCDVRSASAASPGLVHPEELARLRNLDTDGGHPRRFGCLYLAVRGRTVAHLAGRSRL